MAGDQWLIATGNIIIPYDVRMYISMSMSVYLKAASASVCLYSTIHIDIPKLSIHFDSDISPKTVILIVGWLRGLLLFNFYLYFVCNYV